MNKNFFKRPFYYTAGKISRIMRDFQKGQDDKIIRSINKSWNRLFNENGFFEFNLNNDVKINLYKDSVLSRLIYDGFEKEETDYVASILEEGDIFIDIGANVGLFSLLVSKIVGEKGKIICFEPSPATFVRLVENVQLNHFKNIDLRNIGLSDKKEELVFFISKNGYDAWNSFAPRYDNILEESISVPVSTLNIELNNIDKSKIKLVKIDVEGWEKFVLYGGKDFFINYSPIVMIEFTEENTFNAGYPVYEIYDIMKNFGYAWYTIKSGELISETKKLHYPYNNLIAIKNK
jgi:FkbM family methyltransferase